MFKFRHIMAIVLLLMPGLASAQSMVTDKQSSRSWEIRATSFSDYFPFSYPDKTSSYVELQSIFNKSLKAYADFANFNLKFIYKPEYENAVIDVRRGEIDILMGMYYNTKQYSGLEYIYPAALNNPVHIAMLPHNLDKVHNAEDLKSLKGVYISEEYFSDYMIDNFKSFGIEPVDSPFSAYEKLFTGEADFVAGGYYYNYSMVLQLGLKNYVAFSKKPLWNMPMFIGVSKASRHHNKISATLKKYIVSDKFKRGIEDSLKKVINEVEQSSQGIVPPKFVRAEQSVEQTPVHN